MIKVLLTALFLLISLLAYVSSVAIESHNRAYVDVEVSKQVTQQTGIEWDGRVRIAEIEASRDVSVAEIHRDEVVWSSWAWNVGSVIRGLLWVLATVACLYLILLYSRTFS